MIKTPLFSRADDPLVWATKTLVRMKGIRITPGEVENTLLKHPHYPSLAALTEMFSRYKVQTLALRTTGEHLHKMDFPAIAHLVNGNFSILTDVEGDQITCVDVGGKVRSETIRDFSRRWTGALFMADADEEAGDPLYREKKWRETLELVKVPLMVLVTALLTISASIISQSPVLSLTLLLMLAGAVITVVLGSKAFQEGKFANSFCKGTEKVDCNAVLTSPAARLWGMPMANLGFIFFAGMFLSLLFGIISGDVPMQAVTVLNLLSLPYAAFSVYYQYKIVRKWCLLCLAVQGIVVLSAALLLIHYNGTLHTPMDSGNLLIFFASFSLPVFYMLFPGEPFLGTAATLRETQRKLNVWRSDPEFFQILLQRQKFVDVSPFRDEIILGNETAATTMVMVMDPACKPCEKALKALLRVYHLIAPHVKLYLRFKFDPNDASSVYVVDQLLMLGQKAGEERIIEALDDFLNQPYKHWIKKYNDPPGSGLSGQRQRHLDWYRAVQIESTPAFIINGHLLPVHHSVEDFPFLFQEAEVVSAENYNR